MMSSERQTCGWRRQLLIVLVKICLAFAGPLRPLNGTECTAKSPASYILVFTGHWSPQSFPKQYPLFRPPAQWSKLIAVSHNHHFRLWEEGAAASLGVQKFAELGLTVELMKAGKEARKKRTVGAMQRTAGIPNGIGHSSTEVHMQPRSSLVSTGKRSIKRPNSYTKTHTWSDATSCTNHLFDPGDPITSSSRFNQTHHHLFPLNPITSQVPNHPANSFYYPRLKELPAIASIKITRQHRSANRQTVLSNHILPNSISPRRFSETPLDCEVSLWSSWGLCLGPCSRGGIRHRTRYILLRPANAGSPCPELEEQAECVPYSCMKIRQ
uniref:Spondin-2 n=1 Tax=Oryzias latipes TaxID=8090 RepID=A0A3P9KRJ2_ORYLA